VISALLFSGCGSACPAGLTTEVQSGAELRWLEILDHCILFSREALISDRAKRRKHTLIAES
jgi:hypothetical protein